MYKSFLLIINCNATISLVIVYYKSSACMNVNFLYFHVSHDCMFGVMIGWNVFFGSIQRINFESRGYFCKPLRYINLFPLLERNVVPQPGSSNQLWECIIKHDDLVLFAQRTMWIKVVLWWKWLELVSRISIESS
jgi:hypothetical protein